MRDPFAIPPVSAKTTKGITSALAYIREQEAAKRDARDILKGLVEHQRATITYPRYATALRCADIYTEAATSCALSTARLILRCYTEKAVEYLAEAYVGDLVTQAQIDRSAR